MLFKHIDFDEQDEQFLLDNLSSNRSFEFVIYCFLFGFIFGLGYFVGNINN